MPMPIKDLNELMRCNCDTPVLPLTFDISPTRIKVLLVCDGCGKMIQVEGPVEYVGDAHIEVTPQVDSESDDCS